MKSLSREAKGEKLAENGGEIVKTKVCPHCQKEFIPTSNRQIFCSKDCCYQARQDKTKADREAEKAIIIIVSVYVLCVAVPTGLHTVSRNSAQRNVKGKPQ